MVPIDPDRQDMGDDQLARLEAAVDAGNMDEFTHIYQSIDLNELPAVDLVRIARLALNHGAINLAKDACNRGLARFPDSFELVKMHTIFQPPHITVSRRPPQAGTRANTQWLTAHGDEYRGKWVALRAGTLVASATSIDELIKKTGEVRRKNIFITPVH